MCFYANKDMIERDMWIALIGQTKGHVMEEFYLLMSILSLEVVY